MATLSQNRRGGRAAGGSSGPQGTLGGIVQGAVGVRPGARSLGLGDAAYLWVLLAFELGALVYGRAIFKSRHGG
jgi:hypothetical protein